MDRFHTPLPPLTMLHTFEAAARHLSFKHAAQELNVTAGAVSHQIKALEATLNTQLFNRLHRGVELTSPGRLLAQTLHRSFSEMATTLDQIQKFEDDRSVTIGATTAVSSLWLTPRLSRFWKQHGSIPVDQQISDTQSEPDATTDFVVRYGRMEHDNPCHKLLFDDRLIPLCSEEFMRTHPVGNLSDMAQLSLIHLEAKDADWTTWRTWFDHLGHSEDLSKGMRVNNYTIALQAARDGLGLVLGWEKLVDPLLRSKELVKFGTHSLSAPGSFFIQTRPPAALSTKAKTVLDWLLHYV